MTTTTDRQTDYFTPCTCTQGNYYYCHPNYYYYCTAGNLVGVKFGSSRYNHQIKIRQYSLLHIHASICMTISYHTTEFKSISIFISAALDQTAKLKDRQNISSYTVFSLTSRLRQLAHKKLILHYIREFKLLSIFTADVRDLIRCQSFSQI